MTGYWYLATPYTKYPQGLNQAFEDACKIAAKLIDRKIPIFCPIAHTHPIGNYTTADKTDSSYWILANHELMVAAKGIIVVTMKGWEISSGIKHEIEYFTRKGKPILYLSPDNVDGLIEELENSHG